MGIDIDPVAVDSAVENAELNGLADRAAFTNQPLHAVAGRFDLVIANITAPAIVELADDLVRLTAPDGLLALTGVLAEAAREVIAPFDERGMSLARQEEQDEWALLELTHA